MNDTSLAFSGPGVVLLFEDADLGAHLRKVLVEAGARIVHEGPATEVTHDDLAGNDADIVVVNLDAKVERHLDALHELFDAGGQRIIFNDAEASSGLSGWAKARWARHLTAKLMDGHDVDPPRPEQARSIAPPPADEEVASVAMPGEEGPGDDSVDVSMIASLLADEEVASVAMPGEEGPGDDSVDASMIASLLADEEVAGVAMPGEEGPDDDSVDVSMIASLLADEEVAGAAMSGEKSPGDESTDVAMSETASETADEMRVRTDLTEQQSEALTAELEALLAEDGDLLGHLDDASSSWPMLALNLDKDHDSDADSRVVEVIPDAAAPMPSTNHLPDDMRTHATVEVADPDTGKDEGGGFDDVLRIFDATQAQIEHAEGPLAESVETRSVSDPNAITHDIDIADDVAELNVTPIEFGTPDAEPLQSGTSNASPPVAEKLINNKALQGSGSSSSLVDPGAAVETASKPPIAPDWDLVDFDAEPATESTPDVSVEKVPAADSPTLESNEKEGEMPIEAGFGLELEPIGQEATPEKVNMPTAHEMILDEHSSQIQHVVVLGVGAGDDAFNSLKDFLAALDRRPDAVLVGVIHHQTGDDLQTMARELDAVTAVLNVRVADSLGHARYGDLLLVPLGKQAALERSGRIQLQDVAEQSLANPSINLTMKLVARDMGASVLAVVLAGNTVDALVGAQAVSDFGGRVWALDPSQCAANTMALALCEEQLAQHTGTPQDLAVRLLEELS